MQKKINFLIILFLLIVVFHKYFLSSTLVYGDAPYFYREGFNELLKFPSAWTTRGISLGGVNLFLWISPLMYLYGILGNITHFSNDLVLRILFYFPSLIFGFVGVYLLGRHFKFSKFVNLFAVLFYIVNTYYLLLIDGGQVGVVLAYGIFPLSLVLVLKFLDKRRIWNFFISLLGIFILTIVDFRVSAICVFTTFFFCLNNPKKIFLLFALVLSLVGISMYWILPTVRLQTVGINTGVAVFQNTSLVNSLFLFSPNWPNNEFGKTIAPYFYFVIIPLLVFLPDFLFKRRRIVLFTLLFLFFAFLTKGTSGPAEGIYNFFISTKIGSVFRDSTKFFIPSILFASFLIGIAVERISSRFKIIYFISLLLVVFVVWQGPFQKLNGTLGKNKDISDYQKIYHLMQNTDGFFRTVWIDAKSPFAFHIEEKQSLDGQDLVNFRPFASLNVGTGDRFNFFNNKIYADFFKLIGIKYLVLNGNPRVSELNKSDQEDWDRLNKIIADDKSLQSINSNTNIKVYENDTTLPNKFFVDKSLIVLGGDDIYQKLDKSISNFFVGNQGFIFPEDGKFDPLTLQNIASTSAAIVFNNEDKSDLTMSFMQNDFISPGAAYYSKWAKRSVSDFLNYKFELLEHGIDFHQFDYNLGIAFSSVAGEQIRFSTKAKDNGTYYLAIRSMKGNDSGDLQVTFNKNQFNVNRQNDGRFEWSISEPIRLVAGDYSLNIKNSYGMQVVNAIALIPEVDMQKSRQLANNFIGYFPSYDVNNKNDIQKLNLFLKNEKPQQFDINSLNDGWIIFTDSFNNNWEISRRGEFDTSFPMYSMINGFYVRAKDNNDKIIFKGDEYFRWGIYFSLVSLLVIIIIVLWILLK